MQIFILAIVGIYFVSPSLVQALDFTYGQALTVAGTTTSNRAGETVAATSSYLASGAPLDDTVATDAGAVYLYEKVGSTWTFRQKITASDGAAGDQFGTSLAMNGTTLAIGAPLDDIGAAVDAGSVYSFDLENGTWLQTEKLTIQTPVNYERFGTAVDMSSTRLVVGVPGYNGATSATTFGRGAINVWDRQGINWANQYSYLYTSPVSATTRAAFGNSVAISGNKIAVGAPSDYAATTGQGGNAGSMSVLTYNSGTSTWTSEARMYSTTPAANDRYGNSVDIQGNTLVTANFAIASTAPKIFTYTYSAGAWSAPTVIVPASAATRRYIGQAVEIAPDQSSILVGSDVSYSTTDSVGRVFVLKPNSSSGVWEQSQEMASPDGTNTTSTWFGHDVAYAGPSPVIAAPMTVAATNTRGAIYTYGEGDGAPPTLSLTSSASQYVKNPYTVTIDTSEPVVGFTVDDISITGGASLSNFTQVNSSQYTVLVTPPSDGQYTLTIAAGKMQDAAGNGNVASTPLVRTYDATPPDAAVLTPTQSTYFSSPTISASVRVHDVNGGLSGLAADDISISNGTISDFSTTSNANSITGTFTITPTSQGTINFYVKAGAVTDQAGNNSAASTMRTIYYDTGKPTPSFSTPLNPTNQSPFPVTLSFDEPVADIQDVAASQIGITGGAISNFQRVSNQQYTFDVTPAGLGSVTLSYAAGQVNDRAGNSNNAASSLDVEFDNFGPEVDISSPANNPTNQSPIPFVITLSEPASGLTPSDFTVSNGTIGTLTQDSSTQYSLSVTPTSNGNVSLYLPAQKATDSTGNGNQASNTKVIGYDTVKPAVTVSHSYTSPTNASPLIYTIRFSEPVSDLTSGALNLTNATVVSLTKVDSREYTLSVTPSDGTVIVQVPAGAVQDAATNQNAQGSSSLTSDRTAPTGTVNTLHTNNTRPGVSGTISEPADTVIVTVDGKTVNASIDNTARTWKVGGNLFGPLTDGVYDVTLRITDTAGNIGTDTTTDELTIDTDVPTVTIDTGQATTNQSPINFDLKSDRNISGLEPSDFAITNGVVTGVTETDRQTYVAKVTPQSDGKVILQLNEDTVSDDAGNKNPASNVAEALYDTTRPQITLSGPNTPTKNSFDVTADSSEKIEALTANDIAVTRGTVTDIQKRSDQRYVISIQPTSDGTVSVQVPANRVADDAGNLNTASNIFERSYDTTAPARPTVDSQTVTDRQPIVTGTFDDTDTNTLRVVAGSHSYQSGVVGTPLSVSGNRWSLNFEDADIRLEYGTYDVRVTSTDAAGNSSSDTSKDELTINSPGQIAATVDEKVTAEGRPELTGTVSRPNATVDVKILDKVYRATNNKDGTWTLPANTTDTLADGTYDIQLTLVDGNLEGSDSTKDELTIDSAAPRGTFTRIITTDTSPRLSGTIDTSSTRVQVQLEGKLYSAVTTNDNRWVIEKGTISPALTAGTHLATLYMQRNDKEAVETVRHAITVQSNGEPENPQPPEEGGTDGGGTKPKPSQPIEQGGTDTTNGGTGTSTDGPKRDGKSSQNDNGTSTTVDENDDNQTGKNSLNNDGGTNKDESYKKTPIGIAVVCLLSLAAAGIILFVLIGWKRKRKKDKEDAF